MFGQLLVVGQIAFAQYSATIQSGRPGQSIGPFTVGKDIFQIQSGVDITGFATEVNTSGGGWVSNHVIRYGLAERLEISSLLDYRAEKIKAASGETRLEGLSSLDLGGRYHIYSGHGLTPSIGFQLRVRLPVLSEDYKIDRVAPQFAVATSQNLWDQCTLVTNWGATWDGISSDGSGFYTVNVSFPLSKKWSGFIENYGTLASGDFTTRVDTGIAWLWTSDLQLDVLGGLGKNYGVRDYFISAGLSWRKKQK